MVSGGGGSSTMSSHESTVAVSAPLGDRVVVVVVGGERVGVGPPVFTSDS